jgi:endothelin-converting enzyme/putative endopeptidase
MKKIIRLACLAFLSSLAAPGVWVLAQTVTDQPIPALPYTPSLDVTAMDKTVDPCEDFYRYTCGGWIEKNPIPADQSSWSVYGKLAADNQRFLWGILQSLGPSLTTRSPAQQKIGDFFAACMDTEAVDTAGLAPLQPTLNLIDSLDEKASLAQLVARLHREGAGGDLFFGAEPDQDFADSNKIIMVVDAGGLGLPDRDYYTKDDERSVELRAKYKAHVMRMLSLIAEPGDVAAKADMILGLETKLAEASLTRVQRRDPKLLFHDMKISGLKDLAPNFNWDLYFPNLGLDRKKLGTINVTQPAFQKAFSKILADTSLDDLKSYMRWHVAHERATLLSKDFVDESFDFYSRTLRGVPEQKPRWKRCVTLVDQQLGEALGQEFVNRVFSPTLKARTLRMTHQIEEAMAAEIKGLSWMGADTKKRALAKLNTIVNKIGYPDKWRDYSSVQVTPNDFFGNVMRSDQFETARSLAKIGKPVDRGEWGMTPQTVNAYYNPQMNDINFPAGVLQPPLYDAKLDDAPNYGNTGGTIGHELTHGFDDEGRQFDAKGNLTDWWAKADDEKFNARAQCVVDQYAQYVVVDDIKINSKLTLGEDIADLGGLILGWIAWKAETKDKALVDRDGFSPEQRFFIGYAQWACEDRRPEQARVLAATDPHSPGKYRVNGLVANMPQFAKAFMCKPGQAMVKPKVCEIW